jgi:hypothetical protein
LFPLFVVALGVIAAAAFERARASQRLKPRGARRLAILTDPTRGDVVLLIVSLVVVLTPIVLAAIAIFG